MSSQPGSPTGDTSPPGGNSHLVIYYTVTTRCVTTAAAARARTHRAYAILSEWVESGRQHQNKHVIEIWSINKGEPDTCVCLWEWLRMRGVYMVYNPLSTWCVLYIRTPSNMPHTFGSNLIAVWAQSLLHSERRGRSDEHSIDFAGTLNQPPRNDMHLAERGQSGRTL